MGKQLGSNEGDAQRLRSQPIWFFRDKKSRQSSAAQPAEEVAEGNNETAVAKARMGHRVHGSVRSR